MRKLNLGQLIAMLNYIEQVRAVRPWTVFRVTADGIVELDTGDLIQ